MAVLRKKDARPAVLIFLAIPGLFPAAAIAIFAVSPNWFFAFGLILFYLSLFFAGALGLLFGGIFAIAEQGWLARLVRLIVWVSLTLLIALVMAWISGTVTPWTPKGLGRDA